MDLVCRWRPLPAVVLPGESAVSAHPVCLLLDAIDHPHWAGANACPVPYSPVRLREHVVEGLLVLLHLVGVQHRAAELEEELPELLLRQVAHQLLRILTQGREAVREALHPVAVAGTKPLDLERRWCRSWACWFVVRSAAVARPS